MLAVFGRGVPREAVADFGDGAFDDLCAGVTDFGRAKFHRMAFCKLRHAGLFDLDHTVAGQKSFGCGGGSGVGMDHLVVADIDPCVVIDDSRDGTAAPKLIAGFEVVCVCDCWKEDYCEENEIYGDFHGDCSCAWFCHQNAGFYAGGEWYVGLAWTAMIVPGVTCLCSSSREVSGQHLLWRVRCVWEGQRRERTRGPKRFSMASSKASLGSTRMCSGRRMSVSERWGMVRWRRARQEPWCW